MKLFSFLLLAFTLPLLVGMLVIQGAPIWWNLYILSEDMYDIIAQNIHLFDGLRILLIVLFSFAFSMSLFYRDKNESEEKKDNGNNDEFPPQINPKNCFQL